MNRVGFEILNHSVGDDFDPLGLWSI